MLEIRLSAVFDLSSDKEKFMRHNDKSSIFCPATDHLQERWPSISNATAAVAAVAESLIFPPDKPSSEQEIDGHLSVTCS